MAIGGHHSPVSETDVWLTPPHVLEAVGPFDLDPCAVSEPRPWVTAAEHYVREQDGLSLPWTGTVWCNPPYGPPAIVAPWMKRCAEHGNAMALVFARTEVSWFFEYVWGKADAIFFIKSRLHFHFPDGKRAPHNSGAPSVLVAYGQEMVSRLQKSPLSGCLILLT